LILHYPAGGDNQAKEFSGFNFEQKSYLEMARIKIGEQIKDGIGFRNCSIFV